MNTAVHHLDTFIGIHHRTIFIGVLFLGFFLRFIHFGATVNNPLSYQLSADEDYYFQFASHIADSIAGLKLGHPEEYFFMDPLYGYLIGVLFGFVGKQVIPIFFFQMIVDLSTGYFVYKISEIIANRYLALLGMLLYFMLPLSIMFSATLLKVTFVTWFMAFWLWLSLMVLSTKRLFVWFAYGVFLGLGVALRSNLLLIAVGSLGVIIGQLFLNPQRVEGRLSFEFLKPFICLLFGFVIVLVILLVRNTKYIDHISITPFNSGVVLHQAYNEQNTSAQFYVPSFVSIRHPVYIMKDYWHEAEQRSKRVLTASEMNQFWIQEAKAFIFAQPLLVVENTAKKMALFFARRSIPDGRSLEEEKIFSRPLGLLPNFTFLLAAFGLIGIISARVPITTKLLLLLPIVTSTAVFSGVFAIERFRFVVSPVLAIGTVLGLSECLQRTIYFKCSYFLAGVILLTMGFMAERSIPAHEIKWHNIAWGYLKSGQLEQAQEIAKHRLDKPDDALARMEVLGYLANIKGDYNEGINWYKKAIAMKADSDVNYYNLSVAFEKLGRIQEALNAMDKAIQLNSSEHYERRRLKLRELLKARRQ